MQSLLGKKQFGVHSRQLQKKVFSSVWIVQTCLVLLVSLGIACKGPKNTKTAQDGDPAFMWSLTNNDPIPLQLSWMEMKFDPFVFNTSKFPTADFAQPETVKKAIGNYSIAIKYYNVDFKEVDTADKPGRYGAVVNIKFASGINMKRYYTIFKYPRGLTDVQWWQWAAKSKNNINFQLPAELGINPDVQKTYADAMGVFLRFGFYEDLKHRPYSARLMAGLFDISQYASHKTSVASLQNKKAVVEDPVFRQVVYTVMDEKPKSSSVLKKDVKLIELDRQWWVMLKQRLYSISSPVAKDMTGPAVLKTDVPPLTIGTPEEAKMKPKVISELNDVLSKWAKNSDQAFSVALARHGKIFYQGAFGSRENSPMTMTEKSHIASVNKTFTGILLTMFIDKGLLSLDDEISKFLPGLKDAKWSKPITIRHLVEHTSGLPDLALDEANDVEEVIKPFLPYVKVGERYHYCQTGYILCGKIMEILTGKSFSILLREWLLDPMNMKNTEVVGAASDAWSVPNDLVKIGHLLLNKGSYPGLRYFSSETFQNQMMPTLSNKENGIGLITTVATDATAKCSGSADDELIEEGIYTAEEMNRAYTKAELEKIAKEKNLGFGKLMGHPSVTGTLFCLDPENDLIMVMTRNKRGKNYMAYHKQFMKTIIDNVIK